MHIWRCITLRTCIILTCQIPLYLCSMRIATPARVLAARTGAAQFQEYTEEHKDVQKEELYQPKKNPKRLIIDSADVDFENYQGVVGRPGIDFPILTGIQNTNFNCRQYGNGYFADLDTKCQVFHICDEGKKISFLCPNGTIFRQLDLICDWWFKVDCAAAPNHYAESSEMLTQAQRARIQSKHPIPQPIKSPEQFSLNIQRKHALLNTPVGPNLNALAFNRRMDTSVEESDESIDFEDISLKRNNVRRSNTASRLIKESSEETQSADESASFLRGGKTLNGYNYPMPEKKFDNSNPKYNNDNYDKPIKLIAKNDKVLDASSRLAKVLESNSGKQFGSKNSFTFDAKPFITRATENPTAATTMTIKQHALKATTVASANRGSTTHQTSTLNQKSDRRTQPASDAKGSKTFTTPVPDGLNFAAYTTARKPSTKTKDKPFYTPTIPTVTKRIQAEQTTPVTPITTVPTQGGAAEHAKEMMKTLQSLDMSEPAEENRQGREISPSSGPNVLHSLALYFANDSGSNATTHSPISTRLQTDKQESEKHRKSISPSLLSQKTIDKYKQLFDTETSIPTTESLEFDSRISEDSGNDLEGQFSGHPIFRSSGSPQIRELAQVFTHALSAYLQDPESFRHILSEIRPKAPQQLITSNQIDNRIVKNDDICTEEASYIASQRQITPAPGAILTEDLEVLDFSDVTLPTTVKRETTILNMEITTEIPSIDKRFPTIIPEKKNLFKKTPASNLIAEELEKTASAYRDRQSKSFKTSDKLETKNELADEVNEELGTLKPPRFRVVESLEDFSEKTSNSSYFPSHVGSESKSTPIPYGTDVKPANSTPITDTYPTALSDVQAVPLQWGEDLSTITSSTDSAPTVYFDLLPPKNENINDPVSTKQKKILRPLNQEDVLEDDEQLQRAQSQSIVAGRNRVDEKNKKSKIIYSFLNLDNALQQSNKLAATTVALPNTIPTSSTTIKGHYITKQFIKETTEASTITPENNTPLISDIGRISPNAKTTLAYTVFLDPLTINDGLMDIEEEQSASVRNAHTYLPKHEKKTTNAYSEPTTASSLTSTDKELSVDSALRRAESEKKTRQNEEESNENELLETMQRKANQMFGDLNDSEAYHLMNVMKTADTNKSVRRLILLLIQTCDDDYDKTVDDSRKALLNALINMDSKEDDSSEIRIITSRGNKRDKHLRKAMTTASTPMATLRNSAFEKLTDTTLNLELNNSENTETTTMAYGEAKSTNVDLLFEASTKLFENRIRDEETETTTLQLDIFSERYTTTGAPTTTADYETTTAALTTTDSPTTTIVPTTEEAAPKLSLQTRKNDSSRVQKSLGASENYVAETTSSKRSNHHSDTRALELLRSLYSLASRWG